jgi:hypothetical protein
MNNNKKDIKEGEKFKKEGRGFTANTKYDKPFKNVNA